MMSTPARIAAVTAGAIGCAALVMTTVGGHQTTARAGRVPVLAELFTSEGCSSCPPADDLLRHLVADQPLDGIEVIALSEHVDYWNRLGWRDPYSSPRFSERQSAYARALQTDQVYTPQLVVDGRLQVGGGNWPAVRAALVDSARSARAMLTVSAARSDHAQVASVRVTVRDVPVDARGGALRVAAAIVEDDLVTSVTRGENARRRLRHDAVVRLLDTVGTVDTGAGAAEFSREMPLDPGWAADRLRVVAFLQYEHTRRVAGAASTKLR